MFHSPLSGSTFRYCNVFLAFLVFSVLLFVSNAEVIGVDLSGNMKQKKQSDDDSNDGLFDPVRRLNRFNFETTILAEHDDTGAIYSGTIKHWVVLFCPPWYEPCQALEPAFRKLTTEWEDKLNTELFSTQVRFGAVDCATEKTLCNQQNVNTYPFVGFYRRHKQVGQWRGQSLSTDADRLRTFLQQTLGSIGTESLEADLPLHRVLRTYMRDLKDDLKEWFMQVTRGGQVFAFLVFAVIAAKALCTSLDKLQREIAEEQSTTSSGTKPVIQGDAILSGVQRPSSASTRCLPEAWGTERASIEL